MDNAVKALVITYPITYKRSTGVEETISISQSITKVDSSVRTAIVTLYKWAISAPLHPSGTFAYTWTTGGFTLPTGNTGGWAATPGASSPGYNLYSVTQVIVDYGSDITTTGISWTNTSIGVAGFAGADGGPGAPGSPGTPGTPGTPGARGSVTRYQTATVNWDGGANYTNTGVYTIVSLFPSSTLVAGDYVTIKGPTAVLTKYYNGSAWVNPGQFIDGNLFVAGTITADKIDTRGLSIKDNNGTVLLQSGLSFIGGESLLDINNQTHSDANSWGGPPIYLKHPTLPPNQQTYNTGDILTMSADIAVSSDVVNIRKARLYIIASPNGSAWSVASYIEAVSSASSRLACNITLPADATYIMIQLHLTTNAGGDPGAGNRIGTAWE